MTVPEIPDGVIGAAADAMFPRPRLGWERPLGSLTVAKQALSAALAATDEHGERWYHHRDEVAELLDLQRDVVTANVEVRLAEYADALRALLDWLERGDGNRHFLRFTADMARARALLADHCPTCGSTDRHRYAVTSPIGDGPVYEYRLENGGSPERRMLPDGKWERDAGCLDQWHERETP